MSHPIKISFPGTPSHARCHRTQVAKLSRDDTGAPRALSLVETQEVTGIPYSDYFSVETSWTVTEAKFDAAGATGAAVCMVTIHLQIHFCKVGAQRRSAQTQHDPNWTIRAPFSPCTTPLIPNSQRATCLSTSSPNTKSQP